jgi:hypothetical protein
MTYAGPFFASVTVRSCGGDGNDGMLLKLFTKSVLGALLISFIFSGFSGHGNNL